MWALKIMTGEQSGKIFQLQEGTYKIGRSTHADICLQGSGVSKIHGHAMVFEDKLILSDRQSRNGLFVNGVKIKNLVVNSGDKVTIGSLIIDVIKLPNNVQIMPTATIPNNAPAVNASTDSGSMTAFNFGDENGLSTQDIDSEKGVRKTAKAKAAPVSLSKKIDQYIDDVALPVVYKLSESYDIKWTVAGFVGIFIVIVTALTFLPVVQISRDFIVDESRRRAESLARVLVVENREYILSENEMNASVKSIIREPGVTKAFLTSADDGHIMAPSNRRGDYSKNPFLNAIRKTNSKVFRVSGSTILMSLPVLENNPITGEPVALAHAVVVYNMDRVALDTKRALGLMVQILIITLIVGAILYFFLYRLIIRPFNVLNAQVDQALKEGQENIEMVSPTPIIQKLISNINSSLSRMAGPDSDSPQVNMSDKIGEASEIVHLFSVPSFAFSVETELFLAANNACLESPFFEDGSIVDRYLEDIQNEVFTENMKDIIERCKENPILRHSANLDSPNNETFELVGKAVMEGSTVSYILFSLAEVYGEDEVAS